MQLVSVKLRHSVPWARMRGAQSRQDLSSSPTTWTQHHRNRTLNTTLSVFLLVGWTRVEGAVWQIYPDMDPEFEIFFILLMKHFTFRKLYNNHDPRANGTATTTAYTWHIGRFLRMEQSTRTSLLQYKGSGSAENDRLKKLGFNKDSSTKA